MRSGSGAVVERERTFVERARRAQIVASAIEVVAERGFAGASLARIAARADISKGLILYHFAGKDELLEAVVAEVFEAGARFMIPRIEAEPTAAGKLRAYLEANLEYIGRSRRGIVAVGEIVASARAADGSPRYGADAYEPVIEGVAWILRSGQDGGEFRPFDAWVMARSIRAAVDAAAGHLAAHPDLDPEPYAAELVALFERATRKEAT